LSFIHWSAAETFAVVLLVLVLGHVVSRRRAPAPETEPIESPRRDIPVRMLAATSVVLVVTTLAPLLGAHLSGPLSPVPGLRRCACRLHASNPRAAGATRTLDGLLLGLIAPAVFFLVLALVLSTAGLPASPSPRQPRSRHKPSACSRSLAAPRYTGDLDAPRLVTGW
jgi:Na+/H+ antiporter NhaD/arsenite permease-like protein